MRVLIENKRILFDGRELEYYPYYFSIWKDEVDHRITVKNVLSQWATALDSLGSREDTVYLPYYLDDQICRYLKAELDGDDVVLTDLPVRDDGWAINLDDLSPEMYSAPHVLDGYGDTIGRLNSAPRFFGKYNAKGLIEGLRTANIIGA